MNERTSTGIVGAGPTRRRVLARAGLVTASVALPLFRATTAVAKELDLGNSVDKSAYYTIRHPAEFDLDYTNALYGRADRMTKETREVLPHFLNMPFGRDPRQRIDLYLPPGPVKQAPVLLFLHGGGFEEGDRSHYGFVARGYAQQGIVVAVSGYRMATKGHGFPEQPSDAKRAIGWLSKNVRRFGGEPTSLFLSGHSVGAVMTGDLGADLAWLASVGLARSTLRGIAPISGCYELTASEDFDPLNGETLSAAYVPTRALQVEASALRHLRDPAPAAVVAYGDGDAYERKFVRSSNAMHQALLGKGVDSRLLYLPKQTHIDTVFSFADESSPLFGAVLSMVKKWA